MCVDTLVQHLSTAYATDAFGRNSRVGSTGQARCTPREKARSFHCSTCRRLSYARGRPSLCRSCVLGRLRPCRDGKARAQVRSRVTGRALHVRRGWRFTSESCMEPGWTPPLAARFSAPSPEASILRAPQAGPSSSRQRLQGDAKGRLPQWESPTASVCRGLPDRYALKTAARGLLTSSIPPRFPNRREARHP